MVGGGEDLGICRGKGEPLWSSNMLYRTSNREAKYEYKCQGTRSLLTAIVTQAAVSAEISGYLMDEGGHRLKGARVCLSLARWSRRLCKTSVYQC